MDRRKFFTALPLLCFSVRSLAEAKALYFEFENPRIDVEYDGKYRTYEQWFSKLKEKKSEIYSNRNFFLRIFSRPYS